MAVWKIFFFHWKTFFEWIDKTFKNAQEVIRPMGCLFKWVKTFASREQLPSKLETAGIEIESTRTHGDQIQMTRKLNHHLKIGTKRSN